VFEFLLAAIEPQVALIPVEVDLDSFDLHISNPGAHVIFHPPAARAATSLTGVIIQAGGWMCQVEVLTNVFTYFNLTCLFVADQGEDERSCGGGEEAGGEAGASHRFGREDSDQALGQGCSITGVGESERSARQELFTKE
jgi:hypothetical protein